MGERRQRRRDNRNAPNNPQPPPPLPANRVWRPWEVQPPQPVQPEARPAPAPVIPPAAVIPPAPEPAAELPEPPLRHVEQLQEIPRARNINVPEPPQHGRREQLYTLLRRNAETVDHLLNGRQVEIMDRQIRVLELLEQRLGNL